MRIFTKILFGTVFVVLLACSVQATSAENIPIKGLFVAPGQVELVTTEGINYQVYLQTIIRNADGQLVNVTESTANGAYIPHMLSDHVFDTLMGEKEIITIDGIDYEKGQWRFSPSLEQRFIGLYPIFSEITINFVSGPEDDTKKMHGERKDFSIWKIHYCGDWEGFGFSCLPVFQVLIPNMTLEPTDTIEQQWTILREVGHSFEESAETGTWHQLAPSINRP